MAGDLPDGVRLVRGTPADAPDVAAVAVAADLADVGEPDYDEAEAAADLANDNHAWWLARDTAGRLLGYVWLSLGSGQTATGVEVVVDPAADRSLGHALTARGVRIARDRRPDRPLHLFAPAQGGRRREWADAAGATWVRRFSRMVADLDSPPAAPELPPGTALTRAPVTDDDLRAMHRVLSTSFAGHFGTEPTAFDDWLTRLRGRAGHDPQLCWLARVDGVAAAVLVGRAMPEMGWVQTLGTLEEFRGRGLGTLLLRTAFAAMWERGWRRVGLGVDTENRTGALRLYEAVGMRATVQWDFYELPAADSVIASPANGSTTSASKNV